MVDYKVIDDKIIEVDFSKLKRGSSSGKVIPFPVKPVPIAPIGRELTVPELFDKYRRAMRNHEYVGAAEYEDMLRERLTGVYGKR